MLSKVKGLVIRSVDIKESDRLLTIYTEEMGLVTALAKGARSLKSKNMATTMQFCYSAFVLYKKGEHYWIRESELIESFFDIRKTLSGLALASYIAEVISDVATAEPDKDLMRLSLNSLFAIASGKYELSIVKSAFEIRCASILGFMPDVLSCRVCEGRTGEFYFDIMDGALTCYECKSRAEQKYTELESPHESRVVVIISEGVKNALSYCIYCPLEKIFSFSLSSEDVSVLNTATELYLLNQLERTFKSLEFYKEVK